MIKGEDILQWILDNASNTQFATIQKNFGIKEDEWNDIKTILIKKQFIEESRDGTITTTPIAKIFFNKFKQELPTEIESCIKKDKIKSIESSKITEWSQINDIEEFVIYPGEERIYEIKIAGKTIKMEAKEIVDYKVFILKFFEEFGVMLVQYKGIGNDWGKLVSYWHEKYGRVATEMSEHLSISLEAKEAIVDYINACIISDEYIVKDGMVTYKNGSIYVPTRIIKKLLKKHDLNISMRKLSYVMKDLLLSGSTPLKIENKSERFWQLNPKYFDLKTEGVLHIEKESDIEEAPVKDNSKTSIVEESDDSEDDEELL